jgi:hypothetical protein
MSDDTTTPEQTTTQAPENVVPFTPASETTAAAGAEASSASEQNPQAASTDASATPAAEQTVEPRTIHDAVNHVLSQVDINTVSHHDVIHDLFQSSQEHAFKLLLAAKLFEQMIIRDATGLKGKVYDLLRHADEAVVNEVHAILEKKVAVPTPTEAIPSAEDQAVS